MKYSKKTIELFKNPKNFGTLQSDDGNVGVGVSGAAECGDVMKIHIKVEDDKIVDAKFQTFGCVSAIAASVYVSEKIKGKTLEEAQKITNKEISDELELPPIKLHCSVLAEEAIQNAIDDLRCKQLDKKNKE